MTLHITSAHFLTHPGVVILLLYEENTKVADSHPEPTHFKSHGLQAPLTYSESVFIRSE